MQTLADRLRDALKARDLTPPDLIARTGLSKGAIYFILDGTTTIEKIRADTVARICKALNISKDWLLHGKGGMEPTVASDDTGWRDITAFAQAAGLGSGVEAQEYAETHSLKFKSTSLSRKRLQADNLRVFYGKGDSMLPRIHDGDAILFDTSDTRPVDGTLYVVQVFGMRDEYFVKRALILDGTVYFESINPEGDHGWKRPRKKDDKKNPIEVIGRVRWIGSWED